ncbi:mycofactocin biosynthesis chaperone MftB [Streptomyces sp. NPDC056240]|uniref:mycofactocin biosynthesis chaperone MftB n=1 Tax=Streptomyces sp. NPDC056240 TaxID=3345759 RepID=UPI0035E36519
MNVSTPVEACPRTIGERFDLDAAWAVHPQVAVRPEPFGALLYHFGTRQLSFLKDRRLLTVVQALADHPTAADACRASGVGSAELIRYQAALAKLAESQMVTARTGSARRSDAHRQGEEAG